MILEGWLERQHEAGMALAAASDLLELHPLGPEPFQRYRARYSCRGFRRTRSGEMAEWDRSHVAIWFADDHLRRLLAPMRVVTVLSPPDVLHPNIRFPFVCLGHIMPGIGLVDLLYQVWEILTYRRVTMREDDALNAEACLWARDNQHRFPTDDRPLKRRARLFDIQSRPTGDGS
jgi:hypothetical protein